MAAAGAAGAGTVVVIIVAPGGRGSNNNLRYSGDRFKRYRLCMVVVVVVGVVVVVVKPRVRLSRHYCPKFNYRNKTNLQKKKFSHYIIGKSNQIKSVQSNGSIVRLGQEFMTGKARDLVKMEP